MNDAIKMYLLTILEEVLPYKWYAEENSSDLLLRNSAYRSIHLYLRSGIDKNYYTFVAAHKNHNSHFEIALKFFDDIADKATIKSVFEKTLASWLTGYTQDLNMI